MDKFLKSITVATAIVFTANVYLPFGVYAKTFEPVQNPTTKVNEQVIALSEDQINLMKSQGLTDTEIKYIQKVNLGKFVDNLDNFVRYDENGHASLNTLEARLSGRSWGDISITNKMIDNYNRILLNNSIIVKSHYKSGYIGFKTIESRGYSISIAAKQSAFNSESMSERSVGIQGCDPLFNWWNVGYSWWGLSATVSISKCGIKTLTSNGSYMQATALKAASDFIAPPVAWGIRLWLGTAIATNWYCGDKGLLYKIKTGLVPGGMIAYWQCP